MITKIGKALAMIAALALLAMPAHALAQEGKSHHEEQPDPERRLEKKQHPGKKQPDRGRHLGWNKQQKDGDRDDNEWYQGQRGRWYREGNRWQWRGAEGDEWYQGQRGHWYREENRWQWRADRGYDKGYRSYYGSAQGQHRQALINQDRRLRQQYKAAFARGDKNEQKRTLELLRETDRELGMTEQQIDAGVIPY